MDRPLRAFQPAALPLEGRILLARHVPLPPTVAAPPPPSPPPAATVATDAAPPPWARCGSWALRVPRGSRSRSFSKAAKRPYGCGDIQGRPVAGSSDDRPVIAGRGRELASGEPDGHLPGGRALENGQNFASVTIPTNAGAPNPGEVDVNLTITPIDPPTGVTVQGGPLELRILAPDATTPPRIIGVAGTPHGIQLMFSKPMNPVQASNVHNYAVRETYTTISGNDDFLDSSPLQILSPDAPLGGTKTSISTKSVPLRSANYDPADFTVTLVPKRKLTYAGSRLDRRDARDRRRRPRPRSGWVKPRPRSH